MVKRITAETLAATARKHGKLASIGVSDGDEWTVIVLWQVDHPCGAEWEEKRFPYSCYDSPEAAKQAALDWLER